MGGNPLVFGQIRPLKQLANNNFSDCWVCIRWGQIYNFSRISKGFAVCFQRLTFFVLSLFFGAVTFLSELCPRYVQDMYKICPRKVFGQVVFLRPPFLSVNTSAFVGKLYGHSLIISKLRVPIIKIKREIFVVTFLSENYNSLIIKAVEKSQLPDKYVGLDSPTKAEVSLPRQIPTKTEVSDGRVASSLVRGALRA